MGKAATVTLAVVAVAAIALITASPAAAEEELWDPTSVESITSNGTSAWTRIIYLDTTGAEARAIYRSDDGGSTWTIVADPPSAVASALAVVEAPVRSHCLNTFPVQCFRLTQDENTGRTRLEESDNGGLSWHGSWEPSPRFSGQVWQDPVDLAIVGDRAVVALGPYGLVVRAEGGDWSQVPVGPVETTPIPSLDDPGTSPILAWLWIAWAATSVFTLSILLLPPNRYRPSRERMRVALLVVLLMALYGVLILNGTDHYPYGWQLGPLIVRFLVNRFVLVGLPVLAILIPAIWARRNDRVDRLAIALAAFLAFVAGYIPPILINIPGS